MDSMEHVKAELRRDGCPLQTAGPKLPKRTLDNINFAATGNGNLK